MSYSISTDTTASGTDSYTPDQPLSPLSMAQVGDVDQLPAADLDSSFLTFDGRTSSDALPLDFLDVDTAQYAVSNHDRHNNNYASPFQLQFQQQQPSLQLFDVSNNNRCPSPLPLPNTELFSSSSNETAQQQQQQPDAEQLQQSVAKESNNRKQRARLNTACSACYADKKSCDGSRPCSRCARLQKSDGCVDRVSLRAKRKPAAESGTSGSDTLSSGQSTPQPTDYSSLSLTTQASAALQLYKAPSGDTSDFALSAHAYPLMIGMASKFISKYSITDPCALIDLLSMTSDFLQPIHFEQLVTTIQPRLAAATNNKINSVQDVTEGGYGVDWSGSPLEPTNEDPNMPFSFATMLWLNNYSDDVGGRFDRKRACTVQVNRAFERLFGYEQVEMRHLFMQYGRRAMYRLVKADMLAKIMAVRLREAKMEQFSPVGTSSSMLITIIDKFGRELQVCCARTVKVREIDGKMYRSFALCFIPFDSIDNVPPITSDERKPR